MRAASVRLIVAVKDLDRGKSRLRGVSCTHEELALAIATDTVAAALRAELVTSVLVVSSDERVRTELAGLGAELTEDPGDGLNTALRHGFATARARDPEAVLGALQSDLPALRADELDTAIALADGERAFCADHHGTGTALLLSRAGGALDPRFGEGSASAHAASGARTIPGALPGLRTDVDTAADLDQAIAIGAGERTRAVIFTESSCAGRFDIS